MPLTSADNVELLGGYLRLHYVLEGLRTVTNRLETIGHGRPRKPQAAVKRHKIEQRLAADTVAQILADYRAGIATPALAERYNISSTAVKRLLHMNGVPMRRYHRLTDSEVQAAVALHEAGWSLAKVARKFDVDPETVRKRLNQLGVAMRGSPDRRRL
jgi:AraC-like DNA-binding protein